MVLALTSATSSREPSARTRLIMRVSGGATCFVALLAFFGLSSSSAPDRSFPIWGSSYAAWASRILLGLVLVTLTSKCSRLTRGLRLVSTSAILILGWASCLAPQPFGTPLYISPLTSVTLVCFALAALLIESEFQLALNFAPWLAFAGVLVNSVTLLGYIYNASPLYGGAQGAVGISGAATSILLGFGFLAAAGPERAPSRWVAGDSVSAQLLRGVLPVTCMAMLLGEVLSDLIRGGERTELALQDALQTFFATLFISGVVFFLARRVGQRLDRAEQGRDRAEAALSAMNNSLTETVRERTVELEELNKDLRSEIAGRREIENRLRESEAKNNALLTALPDWIFRLRNDGTILDFRAPRENSAPVDDLSDPFHAALAAKLSHWIRQNPQMRPQETMDFSLPSEGATYEARFVRTGQSEILAVIRDISELARLEREVLEANVREQRRIGEELHDGLGQQLTAVAFMSKVLELELAERNLIQANQAAEIGRQISGAIGTLRALARGLFRYELGSGSLYEALQDLVSAADASFRVQCTLDADRSIVLPDRTADLHLYRISQEAITNAVKHGKAKKIHLELKREGSKIVFRVQDDGSGAPLALHANTNGCSGAGIGLRTMEFRTRRLGGRFGIESRPGKGTLITCTLPDTSNSPECQPQIQLPLFD
jgi:signal transduction histidine kinase